MRMWMINPKLMCDKHLLGEHGEIHKFRHTFVKGYSIRGRVEPVVQIEPQSMKSRHDQLAAEMVARGMNHKSDYESPSLLYLPQEHREALVNTKQSIRDLHSRCEDCKNRS